MSVPYSHRPSGGRAALCLNRHINLNLYAYTEKLCLRALAVDKFRKILTGSYRPVLLPDTGATSTQQRSFGFHRMDHVEDGLGLAWLGTSVDACGYGNHALP